MIKSFVRNWLLKSEFAKENIEMVYRGEDGSPYTKPNAGETIIVFKNQADHGILHEPEIDWDEAEEDEARRQAKGLRADKLRKIRRRQANRRS